MRGDVHCSVSRFIFFGRGLSAHRQRACGKRHRRRGLVQRPAGSGSRPFIPGAERGADPPSGSDAAVAIRSGCAARISSGRRMHIRTGRPASSLQLRTARTGSAQRGWLAAEMAARWGEGASSQMAQGSHPYEAPTLALDSSLARQVLQWKPLLDIPTAVIWTTDWYRSERDLTNSQIEAFMERARV